MNMNFLASLRPGAAALILLTLTAPTTALAQEEAEGTAAAPKTWTNQADIGMVLTGENSNTTTIPFDNHTQAQWGKARLTVRFGTYKQTTDDITRLAFGSDDNFTPVDVATEELDQLRIYISGGYRRDISDAFFWTVGGGWDKDADAGIESRIVSFAGIGNTWRNSDDMEFSTEYTLAIENRQDEIPDPELGESRPSIRLAWDYMNNLFGKDTTVLTNNMDFFYNLKNSTAYRFINTPALTMGLSNLLSLRTSLEFRYDNVPGLETVDLWDVDPTTNPDAMIIGNVNIRKKKLTVVFSL